MYKLIWSSVLAGFWLLLSGFFKPLLLMLGAISVGLVVWLMSRMDVQDQSPQSLRLNVRKINYFVWLLGQIVLSSVEVAKAVWRSPQQLNPVLGEIKTAQLKSAGRVLYANSITLTPGTLSVDLDNEKITVHALNSRSLDDLHKGEMEARIAKVVTG